MKHADDRERRGSRGPRTGTSGGKREDREKRMQEPPPPKVEEAKRKIEDEIQR